MSFPTDEDGRALARIAASGINMSEPLPMEFAIESHNDITSQSISEALTCNGYSPDVYFDEGEPGFAKGDEGQFGPSWTVYVTVITVPSYDNVIRIQKELNAIVVPLGGLVDGWEVELIS